MNDEEKELINNIERALNLSEVKGDLVTIIYNYIVKATINLINKLQDKVDKQNKVIIEMAKRISILYVNDGVCFEKGCDVSLCPDKKKDCDDCVKEYFYKKVEEENDI